MFVCVNNLFNFKNEPLADEDAVDIAWSSHIINHPQCFLMKLRQFWPFQPPPDHTKCYLAAKSSPQPWIHTSSEIKNKFTTLPIIIIRGIAKLWKGRVVSPPHQIGLINHLASSLTIFFQQVPNNDQPRKLWFLQGELFGESTGSYEGACSRKKSSLWEKECISRQRVPLALHRRKAAIHLPCFQLVVAATTSWGCANAWSHDWPL